MHDVTTKTADTGLPETLLCGVSPAWSDRYRDVLQRSHITVEFVADGSRLARRLADDWTITTVVLDMGLAVPELAAALGQRGPRLLAFGDPNCAGIALGANLVDFLDQQPSDEALLGALATAALPDLGLQVGELSDRSAARRGAAHAEAQQIAAAVARLAELRSPTATAVSGATTAAHVRTLIRARRVRERYLPAEIFSDPAWDMLLDLTAARLESHRVSVSSLCIAAAVPTTTALRWIRNLCDAGLFERHNDPDDARRAFISLADPAAAAMLDYMAAVGPVAVV